MSGKQVLIVEDDVAMQKMYTLVLPHLLPDVKIDLTADGDAAFEEYKSREYDIVITDLNVPGMDGGELLDEITRLSDAEGKPMPPFLFCSGVRTSLMMVERKCRGIHEKLLKPFNLTQLANALSALV